MIVPPDGGLPATARTADVSPVPCADLSVRADICQATAQNDSITP